jgi:hypothetical protein
LPPAALLPAAESLTPAAALSCCKQTGSNHTSSYNVSTTNTKRTVASCQGQFRSISEHD